MAVASELHPRHHQRVYAFGVGAGELRQREATFKAKVYFIAGMSALAIRAAFTTFVADHRLLPEHMQQGRPFKRHYDFIGNFSVEVEELRERLLRKF